MLDVANDIESVRTQTAPPSLNAPADQIEGLQRKIFSIACRRPFSVWKCDF